MVQAQRRHPSRGDSRRVRADNRRFSPQKEWLLRSAGRMRHALTSACLIVIQLCESSMAFIGTRLRDKAVSNLSKARTLADLDFVLATIEFSLGKSTRHFEYCE